MVYDDAHVLQSIQRARRIGDKMVSFIKGSPSTFANTIYIKYINLFAAGTNDVTVIKTPLEQLLKWSQRLDKCRNGLDECGDEVLRRCRVGTDMRVISALRKTAQVTIEHLEDLLHDAMSNPKAMQAAYKRKWYNFQWP